MLFYKKFLIIILGFFLGIIFWIQFSDFKNKKIYVDSRLENKKEVEPLLQNVLKKEKSFVKEKSLPMGFIQKKSEDKGSYFNNYLDQDFNLEDLRAYAWLYNEGDLNPKEENFEKKILDIFFDKPNYLKKYNKEIKSGKFTGILECLAEKKIISFIAELKNSNEVREIKYFVKWIKWGITYQLDLGLGKKIIKMENNKDEINLKGALIFDSNLIEVTCLNKRKCQKIFAIPYMFFWDNENPDLWDGFSGPVFCFDNLNRLERWGQISFYYSHNSQTLSLPPSERKHSILHRF